MYKDDSNDFRAVGYVVDHVDLWKVGHTCVEVVKNHLDKPCRSVEIASDNINLVSHAEHEESAKYGLHTLRCLSCPIGVVVNVGTSPDGLASAFKYLRGYRVKRTDVYDRKWEHTI